MTTIAWTERTWNPIVAYDRQTGERGWFCTHASPGCLHCYAERMNTWRGNGNLYRVPNLEQVTIELDEPTLHKVASWREPTMVFPCSMTDLFLEAHTDDMIDAVFLAMLHTPRHTYQVLTKRADRMRDYVQRRFVAGPPSHIWLGVSVELQKYADLRIPALFETPAAVRWLSCEPLLGAVDLSPYLPFRNIDWVVIGGESGAGARPFALEWASDLVRQCQRHDVAPFVKQLGAVYARQHHFKNAKGEDPAEWPESLRVREYPQAVA